jgi:hypothetical protein
MRSVRTRSVHDHRDVDDRPRVTRWVRRGLIGIGAFLALYVVSLPLIIGWADSEVAKSHRNDPPAVTLPGPSPIEFGTGGTSCRLVQIGTTFTVRDTIRLVGEDPRGLSQVTIDVLGPGDGFAKGYPAVRAVDSNAFCIPETIGSLPAGHYIAVIAEGTGPLAQTQYRGTFDVTP